MARFEINSEATKRLLDGCEFLGRELLQMRDRHGVECIRISMAKRLSKLETKPIKNADLDLQLSHLGQRHFMSVLGAFAWICRHW